MNTVAANSISLRQGASFEYVISQLSSPMILCVVDCHELFMYETVNDIPKSLRLVGGYKTSNREISTIEYHWRSEKDGSVYTFFDAHVNETLLRREEKIIRRRPIVVAENSVEQTKRYIRLK